jgi:hypothetical protein
MGKRVISLVLEIEDHQAAEEFWSAHAANRKVYGAYVIAMADGDLVKRTEALEQMLDEEDLEDLEDDLLDEEE